MGKKIEEYLHLYYGSDANEYNNNGDAYPCKVDAETLDRLENVEIIIKPILRPLSSMTEQEDKECSNIMFGEYAEKVKAKNIIHYEGEKIRYLLSKHFDLFGLIESGLAIDSTTLKSKTL